MGYFDPDPYGQPEKFGLTMIGEVEFSEPDYSFDFAIVLADGDGALYWARDSGCSCPSPFEDHRFPEDFGTGNLQELIEWLNAEKELYVNNPNVDAEIADLVGRLM
jgi:hypothetical protein